MTPSPKLPRLYRKSALGSGGALLAIALLPKCPLCLAATLGFLGLGASGAAVLLNMLGPAQALFAMALGLYLVGWLRRARAARSASTAMDRPGLSSRSCARWRHP